MSQLPDDLMQELMETFNVEARERLEAANRQLLALEASTDASASADLIAEIFREVHSLKGAAAAVGLPDIRDLSHSLETLFERARSGEVLNPDIFDVLYRGLDAIGSLVDGVASGAPVEVEVARLLADLEAAAVTGFRHESAPPAPAAYSKDESITAAEPDDEPLAAATGDDFDFPVPATPSSVVESAPRPGDETIRVATAKLDSLMAQIGELLVASIGSQHRTAEVARLLDLYSDAETGWRETRPRYRKLSAELKSEDAQRVEDDEEGTRELSQLLDFLQASDAREQAAFRQLTEFRRQLTADGRRMSQIVSDLQDEVRRTRMLPVSTVFGGFPRVIRDVGRSVGKEATLVVEGGEIEVDRAVLELIKDPLTHLLRNAMDHGLESPDRRTEKGKPAKGTITLSAAQRGDSLVVGVSDDGTGIDLQKVKKTALKRGFGSADEIDAMSDRQVLDFIFRSGLSTSPIITDLSGRGVGLDVVREAVERMQGTIDVENRPGQGTTFILTVPLAIATTHCLLVRCSDRTFALPISTIARIVRIAPGEIGRSEGRQTIQLDGRPVALAHMGDALGMPPRLGDQVQDPNVKLPVVILGTAEKHTALVVDELLGAQEVVIKSLPRHRRVQLCCGSGTSEGRPSCQTVRSSSF